MFEVVAHNGSIHMTSQTTGESFKSHQNTFQSPQTDITTKQCLPLSLAKTADTKEIRRSPSAVINKYYNNFKMHSGRHASSKAGNSKKRKDLTLTFQKEKSGDVSIRTSDGKTNPGSVIPQFGGGLYQKEREEGEDARSTREQ